MRHTNHTTTAIHTYTTAFLHNSLPTQQPSYTTTTTTTATQRLPPQPQQTSNPTGPSVNSTSPHLPPPHQFTSHYTTLPALHTPPPNPHQPSTSPRPNLHQTSTHLVRLPGQSVTQRDTSRTTTNGPHGTSRDNKHHQQHNGNQTLRPNSTTVLPTAPPPQTSTAPPPQPPTTTVPPHMRSHLAVALSANDAARTANNANHALAAADLESALPLASLATSRHKLQSSLGAASELSALAQASHAASEAVAQRIQAAKAVHARAAEALEYIEQTALLRRSLGEMAAAMDARNYEAAAAAAALARTVPCSLLNGAFAAKMVPCTDQPLPPAQTLDEACASLGALFLREFESAMLKRDMPSLTRFFRLLPLVQHSDEGLSRYSAFVGGLVTDCSRNLIASIETEGSQVQSAYGAAASRLFESIAAILTQHQKLVESSYGPNAMATVIASIQTEVDKQAGLIIDLWWDERRLERVVAESRSYSYPWLVSILRGEQNPAGQAPGLVDLTEAASTLQELAVILNRWSLYKVFVDERWPAASKSLETSVLAHKLAGSVAQAYGALSLFVFRRSVERAAELDELPELGSAYSPEAPLASSVVEDTMFMLQTLLIDTIDTGDPAICKDVLSSIWRVFDSDFVGVVRVRLRDPPALSRAPVGEIDARSERFLVRVNNMLVASDYFAKILNKLQDQFQWEQAKQPLEEMAQRVRRRATDLVYTNSDAYFNSQIAPQVRDAFNSAFKGSYILSATEPALNKTAPFEVQWHQIVAPLKRIAHPQLYARVMALAAQLLASAMEKWVWSLGGKINELGAIALDRDVSRVIALVSESNYALRQKFVRLAQIVALVGDEDNLNEEYTELDVNDVARARGLRV